MSGAERGEALANVAAAFRKAAPSLEEMTIAETGALKSYALHLQILHVAERFEMYAQHAREEDTTGLPPICPRARSGFQRLIGSRDCRARASRGGGVHQPLYFPHDQLRG